PEELLAEVPAAAAAPAPQADEVGRLAESLAHGLAALEPALAKLDPALPAALQTTRQKATYSLEQLQERIRKAAERRDATSFARRRRLETMLRPNGTAAERLYPPLVPLLAHGKESLAAIREAATGSLEGAVIVNLGAGRAETGGGDAR
ncbi:MAG: hypothetical protein ACRD3M_09430, partial [Thermoanaerobaculia bacterium]